MAVVDVSPRRDGRVIAYPLIALSALVVGLATGEIEVMGLAAVAIVVTAFGLRTAGTISIDVDLDVESARVIEGDSAHINVTLKHDPSLRVDMKLVGCSSEVGPIEPVIETSEGVTTASAAVPAPSWGRHHLGRVMVRITQPGSLLVWEQSLEDLGTLMVLPTKAKLNQLLAPRASQASAGSHPARVFAGDGSEFVDIREYQPGDRLRDLNWRASARMGSPQVNRRRPERGGDVVILLDALSDGFGEHSAASQQTLLLAGRATWSLARNHLAAQDRVGLVTYERDRVRWLPPKGGSRVRFRILETLLGANEVGYRRAPGRSWARHDIAVNSLAIAVSPLSNDRVIQTLTALRRQGTAACLLAVDPTHFEGQSVPVSADVLRLFNLVFQERVNYLRRLGVPVVVWGPGQDLDRAVRRLTEATKRATRSTTRMAS